MGEPHTLSNKVTAKKEIDYIPGVFKGHNLKPVNSFPVPKNQNTSNWQMVVLLFILILFAIVNVFYKKKFKQLISAFFVNRHASQAAREENIFLQRLNIILFINFIFIITLFLYQVSEFYNFKLKYYEGTLYFFWLLTIIVALYLLKMLIVKALGFIFKTEKETSEYIFNTLLFNNILGLVLLPLVFCLVFLPEINPRIFIYTGAVFSVLALIYRALRGYIIGASHSGISRLYLFLYLCTLEFLPLIVIIKVLMNRNP